MSRRSYAWGRLRAASWAGVGPAVRHLVPSY